GSIWAYSLLIPVLALCLVGAQAWAQEQNQNENASDPKIGYQVLLGQWVRPDGGYLISINGVDADGKLDAMYANPQQLPFSKAQASRDGDTIKVFLELRAGGYNGSTYTLVYDRGQDELKGVYYQAVARQKYTVAFQRRGAAVAP
ncbi:MAG: hypothetical protein KDI33_02495, partial [Halioglobus sp.]|nr:hypothetical protein [Halioglobus sp.]